MKQEKNIEVELRTELYQAEFEHIFAELKKRTLFLEEVQRYFVVFFGEINGVRYDCRVRITNSEAEVVLKKGGYHANNRIEVAQDITPDQFLGFVKIYAQIDWSAFESKVCQRKMYKFVDKKNNAEIQIAECEGIYYIEIERIATRETEKEVIAELTEYMQTYGISPISKDDFYKLCKRLDQKDWVFNNKPEDYVKIEKELKEHLDETTNKKNSSEIFV